MPGTAETTCSVGLKQIIITQLNGQKMDRPCTSLENDPGLEGLHGFMIYYAQLKSTAFKIYLNFSDQTLGSN